MQGKITLLFNPEGLTIKLADELAGVDFLKVTLTAEQALQVMSRHGMVDCEFETYGLDKVGKVISRDTIVFEMPKDYNFWDRESIASKLATEKCPEGWEPVLYFGSKDSFFYKNGKEFCQVRIVRWDDA